MSCQQVPTAPAFNPYPRSVQVGEFEVAIGGGIWVAIGVHAEHALLRQGFRWHEVHVWPRGCLTNGSCIVRVVFASAPLYPIGSHAGARNDPCIEPTLNQLAAPVMGSAARLHCNHTTGRQICAPKQELLALQGSIGDHFASSIYRMNLNQILGQVDTKLG